MVMLVTGRASSDVRGRRQEAVRDLSIAHGEACKAARCRSTRDECASDAAQPRTVSRTKISRDERGGGGRGGWDDVD